MSSSQDAVAIVGTTLARLRERDGILSCGETLELQRLLGVGHNETLRRANGWLKAIERTKAEGNPKLRLVPAKRRRRLIPIKHKRGASA